MLVKIDDRTAQALAQFAQSTEFPVIETWLRASRERLVQSSFTGDEVACRQAQGAALAIDSIFSTIQKAQEMGRR